VVVLPVVLFFVFLWQEKILFTGVAGSSTFQSFQRVVDWIRSSTNTRVLLGPVSEWGVIELFDTRYPGVVYSTIYLLFGAVTLEHFWTLLHLAIRQRHTPMLSKVQK
jgi:hypothetical protein